MEKMNAGEIDAMLRGGRLAHLGLAARGEAYVIPVFYAYDGASIYFNSNEGTKTQFLKDTKEACFVVSEFDGRQDWRSIQAFGPLEVMTTPVQRLTAMNALLDTPFPPLLGTNQDGTPLRASEGFTMYRMKPDRISGRKSQRLRPAAL